jgi:hypothetical protein
LNHGLQKTLLALCTWWIESPSMSRSWGACLSLINVSRPFFDQGWPREVKKTNTSQNSIFTKILQMTQAHWSKLVALSCLIVFDAWTKITIHTNVRTKYDKFAMGSAWTRTLQRSKKCKVQGRWIGATAMILFLSTHVQEKNRNIDVSWESWRVSPFSLVSSTGTPLGGHYSFSCPQRFWLGPTKFTCWQVSLASR